MHMRSCTCRYLYTDVLEFKGDVVLDVLLLGRKYMVGR